MLYISFLDIQPTPPSLGWRMRVQADTFTLSLPCPGPLSPREGTLVPLLLNWPLSVSISDSVPATVSEDPDSPYQQITLSVSNEEYVCRILICTSPDLSGSGQHVDPPRVLDASLLDNVATADAAGHALALLLSVEKSILILSKLALQETALGRVTTTSEVRDLLYPISPVAAFMRGLCRVYLAGDIVASIGPILTELCEESVSLSSRSLADQTTFASLAVRLITAAVEIVTTRMHIGFCIALEEAFRLNFPAIPTGPLLGAFLCANLISACIAFPDDFQVPVNRESMPLLTRIHTAVVQALIASVETNGVPDLPGDIATIVHGLGMDIRNKSSLSFNTLASRCHSGFLTLPSVERVCDTRSLEQAARVLGRIHIKQCPEPTERLIKQTFIEAAQEFQKGALERRDKQTHFFHQYHLHHCNYGVHHNS